MLYAGDEIGLEGENGEDGRRPFPWHRENDWNFAILDWVRSVLVERNSTPALRSGGLGWISVTDDSLTFLRETADESVLVHATRQACCPVTLPAGYFGRHLTGLTGSLDLTAEGEQLTMPSGGSGVPLVAPRLTPPVPRAVRRRTCQLGVTRTTPNAATDYGSDQDWARGFATETGVR